jgi:hypothetical protein
MAQKEEDFKFMPLPLKYIIVGHQASAASPLME